MSSFENNTIIIDFDSTFVNCETLDTLARIIYKDSPEFERIVNDIEVATRASMEGLMSIHKALVSRIQMLKIHKNHIPPVIEFMKRNISPSILENRNFISKNARNIFIFSGGFDEIIIPVVAEFGIPSSHVFANSFVYENHKITGIEEDCLLAHNYGKAKQLLALNRQGRIHVLGDGSTDAEMKSVGENVIFYLYTENVFRQTLLPKADKVVSNFHEFLKIASF